MLLSLSGFGVLNGYPNRSFLAHAQATRARKPDLAVTKLPHTTPALTRPDPRLIKFLLFLLLSSIKSIVQQTHFFFSESYFFVGGFYLVVKVYWVLFFLVPCTRPPQLKYKRAWYFFLINSMRSSFEPYIVLIFPSTTSHSLCNKEIDFRTMCRGLRLDVPQGIATKTPSIPGHAYPRDWRRRSADIGGLHLALATSAAMDYDQQERSESRADSWAKENNSGALGTQGQGWMGGEPGAVECVLFFFHATQAFKRESDYILCFYLLIVFKDTVCRTSQRYVHTDCQFCERQQPYDVRSR